MGNIFGCLVMFVWGHHTSGIQKICSVTQRYLGNWHVKCAARSWVLDRLNEHGEMLNISRPIKEAIFQLTKLKKQATMYGSHCISLANMARVYKSSNDTSKPYKFWMEEDMDKEFDIFDEEKLSEPKKVRIFTSWEEDWEQEAVKKRDPVNEAKLLQKYGGLQWYNFDNKNYLFQ
jgi:hypothetical protein